MKLSKEMKTSTVKTHTCEFELTGKDIVGLLNDSGCLPPTSLPMFSEVAFEVPRGGDYSGQLLSVDSDCPVHVSIKFSERY